MYTERQNQECTDIYFPWKKEEEEEETEEKRRNAKQTFMYVSQACVNFDTKSHQTDKIKPNAEQNCPCASQNGFYSSKIDLTLDLTTIYIDITPE